ncbi:MAG: ATPase, T2SS/T4P/T4SS family [Desulfobacterales bacterium]
MDNPGAETAGSMSIGELLIKEGLVKKKEVEKALLIQEEESRKRGVPLGEILIQMNKITREQLNFLLDHKELKNNIGEFIIEKGYMDEDELNACLFNKSPDESVGDCIVNRGYLSKGDLAELQQYQTGGKKLGELAVKLKMISQKDLEEALAQKGSVRTLGEILNDLNLVSSMDLNRVLKKYNKQLRLGEILLKQGLIDEEKLNAALREQRHSAEPLGNILLGNTFITVDQLYTALSKQYNLLYKRLDDFSYNEMQKQSLSSIVTQKYAEKHLIIPLSIEGNRLTLAVSLPENLKVIQELGSVYSHLKMQCVLITDKKFIELYETLYNKPLQSYRLSSHSEITREDVDRMNIDLESVNETVSKDAPYGVLDMEADEVVNFIIKYGIINGASDIHIEQDRQGAKLRYRFDGVLHPLNLKWLDDKIRKMIPAIISRIKVMSNLDIAERRIPQDGVFRINFFDREKNQKVDLDFRVATCPAIVGENVTIRILDPRNAKVDMDSLGHAPHVLDPLKQLLKSSAGMILVSGPTGSGKTSTLYSALQYVYNPGIKIITAEDPIEYSFPGIMQTQTKPKIGLTFARFLRSFLRLDPDVILVGEVRDEETARIAFDAAQTGHLLLSTIHTNDSFSAITRLLDLQIEYNQIASSLMGVLAQRLVRKICPFCRKKYIPTEDEWGLVYPSFPADATFYIGEGCDQCDFTGYKGRTLISEMLIINREIANALHRGYGESEIKRIALKTGMKTMVDDGLMKLNQTTLSEVVRVVPHDMLKEFRTREPGAVPKAGPKIVSSTSVESPEGNGSIVLRNPNDETPLIDDFFEAYIKARKKAGLAANRSDKPLFNEFVNDNFSKICNTFRCDSVVFSLEEREDTIKIFAEPGG